MLEDTGKSFELIQQCDARWYLYYKMIPRLFRARKYLEKYKSLVRNNDPIIQKNGFECSRYNWLDKLLGET